jgi:hypothetical protein
MWSTRYSCQILMELEFSRQIFEKFQIKHLMKIRLVEAELFHTDGRTDTTKLTVAFRNLVKSPENSSSELRSKQYK